MRHPKLLKKVLLATVLAAALSGCAGEEERQQEYYQRALAFYEEGNIEKASVEIRNALQINGDFPDGRYLHALIYEKDQNWQQVYANLNLVVELDPKHIKGLIKLSQIQFINGMYEEVMKNAGTVLEIEPENPDALTLLASVHFRQGENDKAIKLANQALASTPGHVGAISVLSEIYKKEDPDFALTVIGDGMKNAPEEAMLRLMEIDVLLSNQRLDDALSAYQGLVRAYPDNLLFHYRYIRLLQDQGRLDQAEQELRDLVASNPDNQDLKLWLADFFMSQNDYDEAEKTLTGFIRQESEDTGLRKALAKVHVAKREYNQAESIFRKIVELQPENVHGLEARNALVELHLIKGEREQAATVLKDIFDIEPENTQALITRARIALSEGRTEDAISDLRTVTRNQSSAVGARHLLARAHEMEGDLELALDNYRQILATQATEVSAMLKAARLEIRFGNQAAAEELLQSALKIAPDNPQATGMLVELYSQQQRWDEGLQQAGKMIQDERLAAFGHYVKGRLLSRKGDLKGAEQAYRKSLEIEPSAIESLNFLSYNLARQQRVADARTFLEQHLKTWPDHSHAAERLGELLASTDRAQAMQFYQQQIDKREGREQLPFLMGLGQVQQVEGQTDAALQSFRQGAEVAPDHAGVAVVLASLLQSRGNYDEAVRYYQQALRVDPDQLIAANNLANLYLGEMRSPENLEKAGQLGKVLRGTRNPIFLDTLGLISYHNDNLPSAISFFESALASGQAPTETYLNVARAYEKSGRKEKAIEMARIARDQGGETVIREEAEQLLQKMGAAG